MRERTSNDAIVFWTLAVVDFLGELAVQVYYRGQWFHNIVVSIIAMV